MSRQLKISEDVYQMLSLLKLNPSTSFNDVIRDIIQDSCPFLSYELDRISELAKEDPGEAAYELHELHERIAQDYTIDRLIRKKENEKEYAIESYLAKKEREDEEAITRYLEQQEKTTPKKRGKRIKKLSLGGTLKTDF